MCSLPGLCGLNFANSGGKHEGNGQPDGGANGWPGTRLPFRELLEGQPSLTFAFGTSRRMNIPDDRELFSVLKQMRSLYPDLRFGQLVCNLATWARGPEVSSVWDVEDQELLATAREHIRAKQQNNG